jgi:hypothetical protein
MQRVLEQVPDKNVRAYIVWLPMLESDNREQAERRSAEFADERLSYFWDGDQLTGAVWEQVLDLSCMAWDIYVIYGEDARWEQDPPVPEFWMHQLSRVSKGLFLDREQFEQELKAILEQAE